MPGQSAQRSGKVFKRPAPKVSLRTMFPKMSEGLTGVMPDGTNVEAWEEGLYTKSEAEYGFPGKCLRDQGYTERPARSDEDWDAWQEVAAADEQSTAIARAKYATELFSLRERDLETHGKIFSLVESTLTNETTKKLDRIAQFTNARDANDPVLGMTIIKKRIVLGMEGLSEMEQQGAHESFADYLSAVERIYKDLEELESPQLPEMEALIQLILIGVRNKKDLE